MNRLLRSTFTIVWGLWFGGLVMLFIVVQSLFQTFATDHSVAGTAASAIFREFNSFRLIVAAAALLIAAAGWLQDRTGGKLLIFVLFALAALAAVASSAILTPKIEHLRILGLTQSHEFARLHGISMGIYLIETVLLFLAGVIFPNVGGGSKL
ncbi:MAG TPA: DUF4149 domain-containing protein [Tepidisphaeraceae bacterium]|jgi:nitrate/nitrite transporter NarK|nr:DUF4149 domain-containing protein [Tepidisphaeraceae bacterium]